MPLGVGACNPLDARARVCDSDGMSLHVAGSGPPGVAGSGSGSGSASAGGAPAGSAAWALETNLKGATAYTFGPLVAVSGRNQRGKTALLQAVQLAVTGRLPGIKGSGAWPDGNPKQVLDTFAPAGATEVYARLTRNGQPFASYLAWMEGKSARRTHSPPAQGRMPLADAGLAEAVRKTGKGAAMLLVETFGAGKGLRRPRAATASMVPIWSQAVEELGVDVAECDPLAALADIATWANKRKTALGVERNRHKRAIEDHDPSEWAGIEDLPRLEAQLADAKVRGKMDHSESTRFLAWYQQTETLYGRRLAEYQQTASVTFDPALQTRVNELGEARRAAEATERDLAARVRVNETILQFLDPTKNTCFLCGHPMQVEATREAVGKTLAVRRGELAEAQRAANQTRMQELAAQRDLQAAQVAFQTAKQSLASLEGWLEQTRKQLDDAAPSKTWHESVLADKWEGPSIPELQAQVQALKEAETRRLSFEEAESKAAQAEAEQAVVKHLGALVTSELTKRVADAKKHAETAVARYMPTDVNLEAVWDDELQGWGVLLSGQTVPRALSASGYEENALTTALTMAYADARAQKLDGESVGPSVVLLDDKHTTGTFDRAHLRALMDTLGDRHASGEVALAVVVLPPALEDLSCVPEGWSKVLL
jgi:hypothetical protein